ncbi:MAG: hypothetical protein P4L45_05075 [Ignavibacteriaceae bacterium]|nr:hypothetical protein [Ignavibacteriaceae bacterium]
MKAFFICFAGFLLLINTELKPQAPFIESFNFVNYPHSVRNFGMGMQGVVSTDNLDALTYNPANLVFTEDPQFSFFHQGYQMRLSMPINDYSFYYNAGTIGSFAISYTYWDWGKDAVTPVDDPDICNCIFPHQIYRSIAAGYANKLSENLSIGADLRFGFGSDISVDSKAYLFSIGINDKFLLLNRNWVFGFSIMNLGSAQRNSSYYSLDLTPPTLLSAGLTVPVFEDNFLSVPVSLSFSKPFDKPDDDGNGQSSFETLFTDWADFPNDASFSPGLAFEWKPVNLGEGFSISQKYYLGNYSLGVKSELIDYYTHGAEISIGYNGVKLSAGYAGVWFNLHKSRYFNWRFPYETFQFSISANENFFRANNQSLSEGSKPANVIVSAGVSQLLKVGKAKYQTLDYTDIKSDNNPEFSLESAFYLNTNTALVAFVSYNSMPLKADYLTYNLVDEKFETFTAGSLFRYHPFENLSSLFFQAGIGISRVNPVLPSSPRYYYIPAFIAAAGYNIEINDGIILTPTVGYNLSLKDSYVNASISDGENQFNIGIKLGYKISL